MKLSSSFNSIGVLSIGLLLSSGMFSIFPCDTSRTSNKGGLFIFIQAQSDYDNYEGNDAYNNEYYNGGYENNDATGMGDAGEYYASDYNNNNNNNNNNPYEQDSLYADYAMHQQEKEMSGAGIGTAAGGVGFMKLAVGCAASWFVGGKFHSGRVAKKLKQKFQKEQKQLYTQYYNDVYKLSEQNAELSSYTDTLKDALKQTEAKHELEAIQREYDEFKQPDIDGDDRISRAEFNMYVKNYLSNYPGLTEADYPKFEDFDHDNDGYVSFTEYAQQMALAAQKAEMEELYGKDTTTSSSTKKSSTSSSSDKKKAKAYNDLYESSVGSARTKMYR